MFKLIYFILIGISKAYKITNFDSRGKKLTLIKIGKNTARMSDVDTAMVESILINRWGSSDDNEIIGLGANGNLITKEMGNGRNSTIQNGDNSACVCKKSMNLDNAGSFSIENVQPTDKEKTFNKLEHLLHSSLLINEHDKLNKSSLFWSKKKNQGDNPISKFKFIPDPAIIYQIKISGKYLCSKITDPGIVFCDKNNDETSKWVIEKVQSGYKFFNRNKCLNVVKAVDSNGNFLNLGKCDPTIQIANVFDIEND